MKIHMRPPLPPLLPAPPPKSPPTAFQLDMQTEELTKVAQQQKDRLKKLYGGRKNLGDLDEDTDSETQERDHRSNRNLDFLA
jgi:hypothetical protein